MKIKIILIFSVLILLTACDKGNKAIENAINNGEFSKAEAMIKERLEADPQNADLVSDLAYLYITEYFPTYDTEQFLTPLSSNWEYFPSDELARKTDIVELGKMLKSADDLAKTAKLQYFLMCYNYYRYKYHDEKELLTEIKGISADLMTYSNPWQDNALIWQYYIDAGMSIDIDIDKFTKDISQYQLSELYVLKDLKSLAIKENGDELINGTALSAYKNLVDNSEFANITDSVFIYHQILPVIAKGSNPDKVITFLDSVIDLMLSKSINHFCMWEKGKLLIENGKFSQAEKLMNKVIDQKHSNFDRSALKIELADYAYNLNEFGSVISLLKQIEDLDEPHKITLWESLLEIDHEADADAMYNEIFNAASAKEKKYIKKVQYRYDLSKLVIDEVDYWSAGDSDIGVSGVLKNKSLKTYSDIKIEFKVTLENGEKTIISYVQPVMYAETEEMVSLLRSNYKYKPKRSSAKVVSFGKVQ